MKQFNLLLLLALLAGSLQAQRRYYDEVFTNVDVELNTTYGINATVLALAQAGQAIPQPLRMDVYTPDGDTETARPLVIIMHTGNFLPPSVNGGCSGTIKDADDVEIAKRLARMGYVAAVADYRLGWNPIASTQTERVFTLINAAYRGVQDSRTAIRYFRKNHQTGGNTYGIDPNKITLWGIGTGGYISLASATLDTVTDTYVPKFLTANGPMIIEPVNGNVDGTTYGVTFPGYPGFPAGDTLNYPNHVGFSSEFGLAVNLGGALGDLSWIDPSDPAIISFHTPTDPFAPCGIGIVNVPPPINLPVVEVAGSCAAQPVINAEGLNNAIINADLDDALSDYARSINGNIEGFYPFIGTIADDSSPWAYASSLEPYGVAGSNCDTNSTLASTYIDTILAYFAPRACAVFGLYADCETSVGTNDLNAQEVGMSAQPNPATESFLLQTDRRYMMRHIELLDVTGRVVGVFRNVNDSQFTIQRNGAAPGVYFARVTFREGTVMQKVVLH